MSFMIETSARHIHLTQETVEKLFGAGYQLTIRKQSDATGFINIYGLPTKVQAIVNSEKEGL